METNITSPPKKFRWFWQNPDKGYVFWQFMLIAAITASCVFNAAHAALMKMDAGADAVHIAVAVIGAVIPPLFFFAIVEGVLLIWHRSLSRSGTMLLSLFVVAAGFAAGSRSFFGLVEFSARFDVLPTEHEAWLVFMLPLVTDAFAMGATIALFNLKDAGERKRRVKKRRHEEESIARVGLVPRLRIMVMGGAADVPSLPASQQVDALVEVHETFVEPSPPLATEVFEPSAEPTVETFVEVPAPSPKPSVKARKPSVEPSPNPELIPFMDAAASMVDTSVVARKTATELAQVIAAVEQGKTPNAIKSELGISPGTTAKVSAAWSEWQGTQRLVAV